MRPAVTVALVILVSAFGVQMSGCSSDDDTPGPTTAATPVSGPSRTPPATAPPPGETPTQATPSTTPTATLTATSVQSPFSGTHGPVEKEADTGTPPAILTDVRFAAHDGFDRVVFEFNDSLPGYRVEYVSPPITKDPSDLPVDVSGSAFLKVRFRFAAAHDDAGSVTYPGPMERSANLNTLRELEQIGDFEGHVTWILGLVAEVGFRVTELESPYRIAIDVAPR